MIFVYGGLFYCRTLYSNNDMIIKVLIFSAESVQHSRQLMAVKGGEQFDLSSVMTRQLNGIMCHHCRRVYSVSSTYKQNNSV